METTTTIGRAELDTDRTYTRVAIPRRDLEAGMVLVDQDGYPIYIFCGEAEEPGNFWVTDTYTGRPVELEPLAAARQTTWITQEVRVRVN